MELRHCNLVLWHVFDLGGLIHNRKLWRWYADDDDDDDRSISDLLYLIWNFNRILLRLFNDINWDAAAAAALSFFLFFSKCANIDVNEPYPNIANNSFAWSSYWLRLHNFAANIWMNRIYCCCHTIAHSFIRSFVDIFVSLHFLTEFLNCVFFFFVFCFLLNFRFNFAISMNTVFALLQCKLIWLFDRFHRHQYHWFGFVLIYTHLIPSPNQPINDQLRKASRLICVSLWNCCDRKNDAVSNNIENLFKGDNI